MLSARTSTNFCVLVAWCLALSNFTLKAEEWPADDAYEYIEVDPIPGVTDFDDAVEEPTEVRQADLRPTENTNEVTTSSAKLAARLREGSRPHVARPAPLPESDDVDPNADDVSYVEESEPVKPVVRKSVKPVVEEPATEPRRLSPNEGEVVRERYPNRQIKVERHVALDQNRNYVNHGPWSKWDEAGNLLGSGNYENGLRTGQWKRWFFESDSEDAPTDDFNSPTAMLDNGEYQDFEKPFRSEAEFNEGRLVGTWCVFDAHERPIVAWQFDRDQLHGQCKWWYPNGKLRREINFTHGVVEGKWLEWSTEGVLLIDEDYTDGRRMELVLERYPSGEKLAEGSYLTAREVAVVEHEWWQGTVEFKLIPQEKVDVKHGVWTYWYPSGGRRLAGEMKLGKPTGHHTWWYENGQKNMEGDYADGQQHGVWTWWHENGLRKMTGRFENGRQAGEWITWHSDGRLETVSHHDPNTKEPVEQAAYPHPTQPAEVQQAANVQSANVVKPPPAPPARTPAAGESAIDFNEFGPPPEHYYESFPTNTSSPEVQSETKLETKVQSPTNSSAHPATREESVEQVSPEPERQSFPSRRRRTLFDDVKKLFR